MTGSRTQGSFWALSGMLFAVFFITGLVLGGLLSSGDFPLPGAPASEVASYFTENRNAVLVSGLLQALSAASLLVFRGAARRTADEGDLLAGPILGGGALAAILLLLSSLLSWVLALTAAGGELTLIDTLRNLNFLTGGTLHVASLGVFVGAVSIAALRAKTLPGWIVWVGIAAAALSIMSLASLLWFPASILIPLGRLLSFVWIVAVSLVLVRGRPLAG